MVDDKGFGCAVVFLLCCLLPLALLEGCKEGLESGRETATQKIRSEAVKANAAEYYIDKNNQRQFRWLSKEEESNG